MSCADDEIFLTDDEISGGPQTQTKTDNLTDPALSWSLTSSVAILGADNTFPTISNKYGVPVSYASSDNNVATISQDGTVTLVAAGITIITVSSSETSSYEASSADYTLTVKEQEGKQEQTAGDEETSGAGTYTFSSTGDPSSDDDIANTTFTRMITVKYSENSAAVTGDDHGYVSAAGANVTVNNTGAENIIYKLTGSTSNGSFKLYSSKKQAILLSGVSITNPDGAAVNNQSGKRTFVIVEGTNTLTDSPSAAYTATGDEDMKAVFFSEGQLIFSGSGSLTVTASNRQGKSGIVSDDYVRIMANPSVKVTSGSSAGHGLKGKDYVQISEGQLTVSTLAAMKKGIASDDHVLVEGGTTEVTVSGGVAYDSEDSEYKGSAGIKADNYFGMTGGSLTITNTGKGGKGISAGSYDYDSDKHTLSDSYISGGTLRVNTSGSESNDVSSKGIKIGYKQRSGNKYVYAGNLVISGGSVIVFASKSEGIEAKGNMTFNGGQVHVTSTGDDAINCQGEMIVNDGFIYAYSTQNDAMDSNGNMKLNGGYVFAVTTKGAPEVALDANTEGGYKLYIGSGATVVAYGGLEGGYSASQTVYSMGCSAGGWNALHDGSSYIAAFKVPSGISTVAVSAPSLKSAYKGVTVSGSTLCDGVWATSGISGGSTSSLSTYSGGGMGPGGGGMGGHGGGPGRGW
ncbi:MAG: carbohydrate-binding domain-containing protein [Bacteroidales bacterium]|nr:carbohydrate-binding domain-containing protein [Bacteroidales bacterium]